jgi:hypothetical protein
MGEGCFDDQAIAIYRERSRTSYFPCSFGALRLLDIHPANAFNSASLISVGRKAGIAPRPERTIAVMASGGRFCPRMTGPTFVP